MEGPGNPTRVDPLKQALGEYLLVPGVKAAILVSDQGLMICGAAHDHVDTAGIAALVIDTVVAAQRFGLQLRAGQLDTITIEFEKLSFILAPFTSDVMLALVAVPGSLGGSLGALQGVPSRGPGPAPVATPAAAATTAGATEPDQG